MATTASAAADGAARSRELSRREAEWAKGRPAVGSRTRTARAREAGRLQAGGGRRWPAGLGRPVGEATAAPTGSAGEDDDDEDDEELAVKAP